eukprot:3987170-Pleurochrysis_carterae.AAC.2
MALMRHANHSRCIKSAESVSATVSAALSASLAPLESFAGVLESADDKLDNSETAGDTACVGGEMGSRRPSCGAI